MRLVSFLRIGIVALALLFVPDQGKMQNANIKMENAKCFILHSAICTLQCGAALAAEGDIVFKPGAGDGGISPAIFPHWIHRLRYKCYACHPALFEMKTGANKVSMDAIQEGKFCGTCHNDKIAWGVTFETCNRCHVAR